jgi:hypothetical protein
MTPCQTNRSRTIFSSGRPIKLMSLASAIGLCLDVPTEFAKHDAEALVSL